MKRFWKDAAAVESGQGWTVMLDGRPLRTPDRNALVVPTEALAEAIADEWRECGEEVRPDAMAMTGLANAAIDRVAPAPAAFAAGIARYAESDLACYRAEYPDALVQMQAQAWDGLIDWGRRRFDVDFATTCGVMFVAQPAATVQQLSHAVAALDPYRLAALSRLVTIGGSLLAGLAVLEEALDPESAWRAVSVDERWQAEQWGKDSDAAADLEGRERDFLAAARFLERLSA